VVGRILLTEVLGHKVDDFVGIEWWCKNQSARLGAHFHYDSALQDGGLARPAYSSVLYLSDAGGPTVVLDQVADLHSAKWPEVPQEGHVVMPRASRYMVFPGELRHGCMSIDDCREPRFVVLFNFWSYHTPSGPSCQQPDFSSYLPVSASAVAARWLLPEQELRRLAEESDQSRRRGLGERSQIPVESCSADELAESGCTFGELPFAMPMPSLLRLKQGPTGAAVLRIPWLEVASDVLGAAEPLQGGVARRLRLWERWLSVD
ncbi:unnamed protein product, partial [Polarella glacialis]